MINNQQQQPPQQNPAPQQESQINYKELCLKIATATKGIGCDTKTIISIFASLTNEQITKDLVTTYQKEQNTNLIELLKSKTSGDLKTLFIKMSSLRYENWAKLIESQAKNKKDAIVIAQIVSLMDHQDKLRICATYSQLFQKSIDTLLPEIKNENVKLYCKSCLLNEYEATEEGLEAFSQHCQGQVTKEQLFQFLATLTRSLYGKFMLKFRETRQQEFKLFVDKYFSDCKDLVEIHCKSLENPVQTIADIIHQSIDGIGTDDALLIDTTAVFRDYYWKDLTTVYKGKYGDIVNDLKGDLSGKYEDAVLRFWGLVWF